VVAWWRAHQAPWRGLTSNDLSGLGPLTVHVWVVPLDDPVKQRRHELAHAAQDRILAAYLEIEPQALEYRTLAGGKPVLADGALEFNLSHSGDLALVAVSRDLPVGVDLEHPRGFRDEPRMARRICSARELEHLAGPSDPDELLRLWVRKEAVVKATGEGLVRLLGQIDVLNRRVAGGWLCLDLPVVTKRVPADGYRAAVAFPDRPGASVALRTFSWEAAPHR
jgi:4'-phosphopantetheinyl transferase